MQPTQTISEHATDRNLPGLIPKRSNSNAMAGMMMALIFLAREPLLICLRRLFVRPRRSATEQAARMLSLPSLRLAIVGHGKQYITDMFGPPPTTSGGACTIWYYPLHAPQQLAMAISFADERAVDVEFFHSPF
jgi:hypothetical protein